MNLRRLWLCASAAVLLAGGCASVPGNTGLPARGAAEFSWFEYSGRDAAFARNTPKAGEYLNPILIGFYPDPSLTRVGDDYYLVHSTFAYFPGIPILHSKDLVNWTQIGNAIDRPDQLDFANLGLSRGVFAPTIEHHAGTFYILNTCVDCGGNFLVTAKDPKGPWSDPIWLPDLEGGIDPSLFVDADGQAYILNNGPPPEEPLYDGHRAIWIQKFDLKTNKTFGPRTVLVNGGVDRSTKPIWIEGPHITRVDGRYYLTAAEGGTAEGHSQVVLRADRAEGPYTPWSGNPILTQRGLPKDRVDPITSAGHADMVQTPSGQWWATFLAVRPYGDDLYNTGRETFLLPVTWKDGWPVILENGKTIPYTHTKPDLPQGPAPTLPTTGNFTVREEFDRAPGMEWLMVRNQPGDWRSVGGGALRILPLPVGLGDNGRPAYLGRRQQHMTATASTEVRFTPTGPGDRAGLAAFANDDFYYALNVGLEDGRKVVRLERRNGPKDPRDGVLVASRPLSGDGPVRLKIDADGGDYDFAFAEGAGPWTTLAADQDGSILSTKKAGGFVGVTFGLYAYAPR
jgi:alpha-N-arabinofuranosidase